MSEYIEPILQLSFSEDPEAVLQCCVFLQPQVRLDDGALTGVELLIRGRTATGKIVSPAAFLPELVQRGQVSKVDFFVLEMAGYLFRKWKGAFHSGFQIAINLSRNTIAEACALEHMFTFFQKNHVYLQGLVVELTEQSTAQNEVGLRSFLCQLQEAGVVFSLDDYGSGFSNLKILSEIDFAELKIDQSLIALLPDNRKANLIISSVLDMCKQLDGVRCIAEGIETKEQMELLQQLGCEYGQGFYFYKPMPIMKFEEIFLKDHLEKSRQLSVIGDSHK